MCFPPHAEAAQQQPALQAQHVAALEKAIREHCGKTLAAFKVRRGNRWYVPRSAAAFRVSHG